MKLIILCGIFNTILFGCFAQDSTELPKPQVGRSIIYVYPSIKNFPEYLHNIIDSINASPLKIHDIHERVADSNNNVSKPVREFKSLKKSSNCWLLTYLHRGDKNHIHFIIFMPLKNGNYKLTAGISEFDIDSISTIQKKKDEKSITFINLNSKKEKHKF